jgi:hypothetical protein
MSERDYLLAAIERCDTRARIARGNLDRFTLVPGNPSSERTYRKLKVDWREATEHAEHLRQRLQCFSGARRRNEEEATARPLPPTQDAGAHGFGRRS